jgi:hypothetical protein
MLFGNEKSNIVTRLTTVVILTVLMFVGACTEDPQYDGLFTPSNNEMSSQWRGTYNGTCTLTSPPLISNNARTIQLRIIDLGDESVRVRAYLVPDFPLTEQGQIEGRVASLTRCIISRNIAEITYGCNLTKAGRRVTGSMVANALGGGGANTEWIVGNINVLMEE